jgi:hypothetical protein
MGKYDYKSNFRTILLSITLLTLCTSIATISLSKEGQNAFSVNTPNEKQTKKCPNGIEIPIIKKCIAFPNPPKCPNGSPPNPKTSQCPVEQKQARLMI